MNGEPVDLRHVFGGQVPCQGLSVLFHLRRLRRTGDDTCHLRPRPEPAKSKLEQAVATCRAKVLETLYRLPMRRGQKAVGEPAHESEASILRHRGVALILAGQQATREREKWQKPQPMCADRRNEFALNIANHKTVFVLTTDERGAAGLLGGPQRVDDLPGRQIGATDVSDLAGAHEVVKRSQGFFDRREWIRAMQLIEVDPIGLETFETRLNG